MSDNANKGELFMKIEALTVERDALSQKLRASQHEVEVMEASAWRMANKLKEVCELVNTDAGSAIQWILDNHAEVGQLALAAPQQHLRDVRAEAAIKGWWACWDWIDSDDRDKPTLIPAAN